MRKIIYLLFIGAIITANFAGVTAVHSNKNISLVGLPNQNSYEDYVNYTLTINIIGEGNVIIDPNIELYPEGYPEGTIVNLTAIEVRDSETQYFDWDFEEWSGDLISTNKDETISMNCNKTINLTFVHIPTITEIIIEINKFGDKIQVEPSIGEIVQHVYSWEDSTEKIRVRWKIYNDLNITTDDLKLNIRMREWSQIASPLLSVIMFFLISNYGEVTYADYIGYALPLSIPITKGIDSNYTIIPININPKKECEIAFYMWFFDNRTPGLYQPAWSQIEIQK